MREVVWRIKAIYKRHDERVEIDAVLHGLKYNSKSSKEKNAPKLTKNESEQLDEFANKRMARMAHGRKR